MNKKLIIICLLIPIVALVLKFLWVGLTGIKVDEFKPVSVMFLLDTSASNQSLLAKQKKFITQMCKRLDPEDHIKIILVTQDAYLAYEGSPHSTSAINKVLKKYTTLDSKAYGTAYGTALKKGLGFSLVMAKDGYIPAVVVMGDLENEGAVQGQINWQYLPAIVSEVKQYIPELSMTFLFAHPTKLDLVKDKLAPILGEKKLIIASEENADTILRNFSAAIGR